MTINGHFEDIHSFFLDKLSCKKPRTLNFKGSSSVLLEYWLKNPKRRFFLLEYNVVNFLGSNMLQD